MKVHISNFSDYVSPCVRFETRSSYLFEIRLDTLFCWHSLNISLHQCLLWFFSGVFEKTILTISLPSSRTWTTTPIARAKWWGSNLHHDHIHLLHFKRGLHLSYPILFLVFYLFQKPLYQCDFFQSPENPVVSPVSGCVFERRLIVSSFLSRVNTFRIYERNWFTWVFGISFHQSV